MDYYTRQRILRRQDKYQNRVMYVIGIPALLIYTPLKALVHIMESAAKHVDAYLYKLAYKNTMKEEYRYGRKTRHK